MYDLLQIAQISAFLLLLMAPAYRRTGIILLCGCFFYLFGLPEHTTPSSYYLIRADADLVVMLCLLLFGSKGWASQFAIVCFAFLLQRWSAFEVTQSFRFVLSNHGTHWINITYALNITQIIVISGGLKDGILQLFAFVARLVNGMGLVHSVYSISRGVPRNKEI